VARFWLKYRRKYGSRLLGVVIIDSASMVQARRRAAAVVTRALAGSIALLKMLGDAIEPILGRGDARRGVLFGLGAFALLGVLTLLLWRPSTFSPGQTIMVAVLVMVSVIAMLVMDLLD